MEKGLHPDVDEATYSSWDAMRHSNLKLMGKTPAHAYAEMVEPHRTTPAQAIGNAVHAAVLEPDMFPDRHVGAPKLDKRTKAGKAAWAKLEEDHPGKEILRQADWDLCLSLRDAVWANKAAASILSGEGRNEISAVWEDADTGVLCKSRMDRLCAQGDFTWIVDFKTTKDASERGFLREAVKYSYFTQAAFYLDGLTALAPLDRWFVFIAVEKEPPYAVNLFQWDMATLELGRRLNRARLIQFAECVKSGVWPGYEQRIHPMSAPEWVFNQETYDDD